MQPLGVVIEYRLNDSQCPLIIGVEAIRLFTKNHEQLIDCYRLF